jgi:hypothetical protein
MYRRETLSLTLEEEYVLRVFKNRVLKKIFGPKKEREMEDLRKLHDKKIRDVYFSPNITSSFTGITTPLWVLASSYSRFLDHIH